MVIAITNKCDHDHLTTANVLQGMVMNFQGRMIDQMEQRIEILENN